jgi:hypothetical protein
MHGASLIRPSWVTGSFEEVVGVGEKVVECPRRTARRWEVVVV